MRQFIEKQQKQKNGIKIMSTTATKNKVEVKFSKYENVLKAFTTILGLGCIYVRNLSQKGTFMAVHPS